MITEAIVGRSVGPFDPPPPILNLEYNGRITTEEVKNLVKYNLILGIVQKTA
jgi:hypothetical protein